jgi:UDP-2,3-diacylglucosamine pyrophosphatase LpxH
MKIDFISDLHLDMYITRGYSIDKFLDDFITPNPGSRVLVIAGDIGHYDTENAELLTKCAERYDRVYFVLGNHDWYVLPDYPQKLKHARERIEILKSLLLGNSKVCFLDGIYDTFDGITFFGFSGWYDGTYAIENFSYDERRVDRLWHSIMNDSRMIRGVRNFKELFDEEQARLVIDKKADLVVTHVNPSNKMKHQSKIYMNEVSTTFYNFNGLPLVEKLSPQYWLFGHTHHSLSYKISHEDGSKTKIVSNPLGYPWEQVGAEKVRQIVVKKGIIK